jgi:hypothetical protein
MKSRSWMAAIILIMATNAYAEASPGVEQGAQGYDWQTCVNSKASDCINNCETSEDISCKDNCNSMASDKCQSEGLSPPQ